MHLHVCITIIELTAPGQKGFACCKQFLLCQHAFNMWKVLHKYCMFYKQAKHLQCIIERFSTIEGSTIEGFQCAFYQMLYLSIIVKRDQKSHSNAFLSQAI